MLFRSRTKKACQKYTGIIPSMSPVQVALNEEQEEEFEKELLGVEEEDLVNVDGTKLKLSSKLLRHHDDVKRLALLLKVPKDIGKGKRGRIGLPDDFIFNTTRQQTA